MILFIKKEEKRSVNLTEVKEWQNLRCDGRLDLGFDQRLRGAVERSVRQAVTGGGFGRARAQPHVLLPELTQST